MDDGESTERVSVEPDGEVDWGDEVLAVPDALLDAPSTDLFGDAPAPAPSSGPAFTLPEEIWGESAAVEGAAELVAEGDMQLDQDWWLPRDDLDGPGALLLEPSAPLEPGASGEAQFEENLWPSDTDGDPVLEESSMGGSLAAGVLEGTAAATSAMTTPVSRPQPRTPRLAPPPPPVGRWSGMRRSVAGPLVRQRVAALALVGVAAVGALLAMAARGPEAPDGNAAQQIDVGGFQSTSTMPTTTVPRATSTSVTTPTVAVEPAPEISGAPASASPPGSSGPTPVTAAPPRSPAATAAPVTAATSPPPPTTAPAPTPTATIAPTPPPPPVVVLPDPEPEPTVTTRRPRPTVPDTTIAPSTTLPASRIPVVVDNP